MSDRHTPAESLKKPLSRKTTLVGWWFVILGIIVYLLGYLTDAREAAFTTIVNFLFLTSIAVGALFLVALEHVSGAVWSVPMRRVSEFLAALTPVAALLAIPVFFHLHEVYHWAHPEIVAVDTVLRAKQAYLNTNFFVLRFVVIVGIWTLFYCLFARNSLRQDITSEQKYTVWNIRLGAVFLPVFMFSVSVVAIDWAMSLEAHWHSTIFGVYYFSGTVLAALAAVTYIVVRFHERGFLPHLHRDHFYSLGALMFAFVNFWAYIAFSQFMLIWYANLPDETVWFMMRWNNGWEIVSVLLIIVQFGVPYVALLSQNAKMNSKRLKFVAVWLLCAHMLDVYWLVMPTYSPKPAVSWMGIGFPVLTIGLVVVVLSLMMKRHNLMPVGDPKLQRGLDFHL